MGRPVVEHFNTNIFLNSVIPAVDLFNVVDPDGDALKHLDIEDYQGEQTGGYWRLNGTALANGTRIRVKAEDLQFLEYVAGSRISWEGFRVVATDVNGEFSLANTSGRLYTVRENVTRPNVANLPIRALADEATPLAQFLKGNDPDGYPITQWQIRDQVGNEGYISIAGRRVDSGVFHLVKTEDLDTAFYHTTGRGFTEKLDKLNYDGELWSTVQSSVITAVPNVNRPVAQFSRGEVLSREVLPMEPLVNITDDDGNSIKWYEFWNTSPHSNTGTLFFKGIEQARKQWIRVLPEELSQLEYHSPNRDFVQQIRFRGHDGKFQSGNSTISVTTRFVPEPIPPTIAPVVPQVNVQQVELQTVESLFNFSAPGLPITEIEIFDGNSSGLTGEFLIGDEPLARGVVHQFTPAGFQTVDYNSGPYIVRSNEGIYARAGNGDWSPWTRVDMHTEPEFIGAFQSGTSWRNVLNQPTGKLTLTYSFMQTFPDYNTGAAVNNDDPPEQFSQFTLQQRIGTNRGLANLETFANVEFVQIADSATNQLGQQGGILRFGNYFLEEPEAAAFAFFPSLAPEGGDSWYDLNAVSSTQWGLGDPAYSTLLHEVGHAMGLKHPHGGPDNMEPGPWLPNDTDYDSFTVMSYTGRPDRISPQTYQVYDIINLQRLYGANMTYATGDDLYDINFLGNPRTSRSIWDAGGTDEFSAAGTTADAILDLRPGQMSSIGGTAENMGLAFNVDIENATGGAGNDSLVGNYLDNRLIGGDGDDVIEGRSGNDFITGGAGDDRFIWGVADHSDTIDEQRSAGRDSIVMRAFEQVDSLSEDFKFRMEGRDLIVSLRLDGGDVDDGTLRIVNHSWGASQIETLELNGTRIDLRNLGQQATAVDQSFTITSDTSTFGNLVTPV